MNLTKSILTAIACLLLGRLVAQNVDFSTPAVACKQQNIFITNTSTGAGPFSWDVCEGELLNAVSATNEFTFSEVFEPAAITAVEDDGKYFSFVTDRANNVLHRFDFGGDLSNTPTRQLVTLAGATLQAPQGFKLIQVENQWHGFVLSGSNNKVYRLDFGADLRNNSPVVTELIFGANLNVPTELEIVRAENGFFLAISSFTDSHVVLGNLGNAISNPVGTVSRYAVPGASNIYGLSFKKVGTVWKAITSSYSNHNFHLLEFLSGLDEAPVITNLTNLISLIANPVRIEFETWGQENVLLVMSNSGSITRLHFERGNDFASVSSQDILNAGSSFGLTLAFSAFYSDGEWKLLTYSIASRKIRVLSFQSSCDDIGLSYFEGEQPPSLRFETEGPKDISLITVENGILRKVTRTVDIQNKVAPDISFTYTGICAQSPLAFSAHNQSGNILQYEWNFGDGSPLAPDPDPDHTYTNAGEFPVTVNVQSSNGCENVFADTIKLYVKPVAAFTFPPGPLCTNNILTINNQTADNYDGNLKYQWYVNEVLQTDSRDLQYLMSSEGAVNVRLVTSIVGCSDEEVKSSPTPVLTGPLVDFAVTGVCEQEPINFRGEVTGAVSEIKWSFGDGDDATGPLADHSFESTGTYDVTLIASSPNGCSTSKVRSVSVRGKPHPEFLIEEPPSSCAGSPSKFIDLTPPVINGSAVDWEWSFGDGKIDNQQSPTHIYQSEGSYLVKLSIVTEDGCSAEVEKMVSIFPSPVIAINNSATCANKQASFNAEGAANLQFYWEAGTSYYETQKMTHTFAVPGIYHVKLSAVDDNGCIASLSKKVVVPEPVVPVFAFSNNCEGYETHFAFAESGADPVVSHLWNFAGEGTSAHPSPKFTFGSVGNKPVKLSVTTQSGCVYERLQNVNVVEAPKADFFFSPEFGVPPQEIVFTNTSTYASSYQWNFGDNTSSSERSPAHVFTEVSEYLVELTASNTAGCESTISKVVPIVEPLPDIDLMKITITKDNVKRTLRLIVTIANKGNTIVDNLPVALDLSGLLVLESTVNEPILPFSQYNLQLEYAVSERADLKFICASAFLNGDLNPSGNRVCSELEGSIVIISPFPNPVNDFLNVEWIASEPGQVTIDWIDGMGKTLLSSVEVGIAGSNQKTIDVSNIPPGIYAVRIITPEAVETFRIQVGN